MEHRFPDKTRPPRSSRMLRELCLKDLTETVNGELQLGSMPPLGGDLEPVGRIVTDVGRVRPGDVYWALETSSQSLAVRAEEAFARDALGAVVSGRRLEPWAGKFSLLVEDPQWALWQLARRIRAQFTGRVIAITGSLGKTTTRRMIEAVLATQLNGCATVKDRDDRPPDPGRSGTDEHPGTPLAPPQGGEFGFPPALPPRAADDRLALPLSLLELAAEHDFCAVEYSAQEPGEISALSHLCDPQIVVINSLANQRMGWLDEHARVCEAALLEALPEDGWAVLNGDAQRLREFGEQTDAQVLLVGRGSHCDVTASHIRSRGGELAFTIAGTRFRVPVWGRHHLHSALAAYAVGRILEIPPRAMADALGRFQMPPQRCEIARGREVTVIDDTYDQHAASMDAALEVLRDFEGAGRRVVVCGDLTGTGNLRELHRRIGHAVVSDCGADVLVALGRYSAELTDAAQAAGMSPRRALRCQRAEEVATRLQNLVGPGDVVLVKGGRGLGLTQLVEVLLDEAQAQTT